MRKPILLATLATMFLASVFLAGCGGSDSPTNPGGGGGPADTTPLSAEARDFIPLVFSTGYLVSEAAQEAVYTVTEAIFTASDLTGTTTTTGTLAQQAGGGVQYSPTPTDRLVIQSLDGSTVEIVVQQLSLYPQVDSSYYSSAGHFGLADLHQALNFQITSAAASLTVTSSSLPRPGEILGPFNRRVQRTRSIAGRINLPDQSVLTMDLVETATRDFTMNPGQSDATDEGGTITGTAAWNDHAITVNETARFIQERDVTSLDGTPQYTVRNLFRTCASSGQLTGDAWSFAGVSVQSESRNGAVHRPDFWSASGSLRRNGSLVGALGFDGTPVAGGNLRRVILDLTETGQEDLLMEGATLGG